MARAGRCHAHIGSWLHGVERSVGAVWSRISRCIPLIKRLLVDEPVPQLYVGWALWSGSAGTLHYHGPYGL